MIQPVVPTIPFIVTGPLPVIPTIPFVVIGPLPVIPTIPLIGNSDLAVTPTIPSTVVFISGFNIVTPISLISKGCPVIETSTGPAWVIPTIPLKLPTLTVVLTSIGWPVIVTSKGPAWVTPTISLPPPLPPEGFKTVTPTLVSKFIRSFTLSIKSSVLDATGSVELTNINSLDWTPSSNVIFVPANVTILLMVKFCIEK